MHYRRADTKLFSVSKLDLFTSAVSQPDFRVAGVARLRDSACETLNSCESSYKHQPELLAVIQHYHSHLTEPEGWTLSGTKSSSAAHPSRVVLQSDAGLQNVRIAPTR